MLAGNIPNTTIFRNKDPNTIEKARNMFKVYEETQADEQIEWAINRKVDFIIGETFSEFTEAMSISSSVLKGPVAMLPVLYRTTEKEPTMQSISLLNTEKSADTMDLPTMTCPKSEIQQFAKEAKALGLQLVGLCCGNASHYMRILAEVYGKQPKAAKYAPDLCQHYLFWDARHRNEYYTDMFNAELQKGVKQVNNI